MVVHCAASFIFCLLFLHTDSYHIGVLEPAELDEHIPNRIINVINNAIN